MNLNNNKININKKKGEDNVRKIRINRENNKWK
mgnify:CR=1 FL=1